MKVLHIYSGNLFGGVETLLVTLAKLHHFCPQMQPYFALCFEGRLANELRTTGVNVQMLGEVRTRQPWTIWKARRQLEQLLRHEKFDVVICHSCWSQAIFGSVVKEQKIPLVFFCHDTPKGKHWVERWAKQTVPDLVIANSQYIQAMIPNLYPQAAIRVLYLPVIHSDISDRTTIRKAVRAELNTPDDAVVIIQVSRLERLKGQNILISALAEVACSNWVCWIVGGTQRPHEANYLQELQVQAQELGIAEQVKFLGQRTDISRLLVGADIYCQPNTEPEGFGITFVEALYAKLPVVTTFIGGGMEIINDSCGRLVPPNSATALSKVLQSLIINPDERITLSVQGLARANQLCSCTRQITKLYKLLLLSSLARKRSA